MRILLQRVSSAAVRVEGRVVGQIQEGLVLLVGIAEGDCESDADRLAEKVAHLRVFIDAQGKFNRSLLDIGGGALVVPQFTLYADCRKGRRPSFSEAARPELARPLCDSFAARLRHLGVSPVDTGVFGALMQVQIHNDGPVTIWLDSKNLGH